MTDATGRYVPPDEEKRHVIEDAILAFRPEVAHQYQRDPPPVSQALANLAAATNIPRLVKHRRLIDGSRRSSADDRAGFDEQAWHVLSSTLEQGLPDDRHRSLADQAKRQLDEAAAAEGEQGLQPQHSQQWVQGTDDIFGFTTHEQTFEACNDEQEVMKATPDGQLVKSRLIVAQFWSDLPPAAFRTYVDPQNWPRCSPFWRSMRPLRPVVETADGYDGDFNETVDIIGETLIVPLHIGFRELPDQSRVWARFNISRHFYRPTTKVDVDTGTVSAELVPNGPAPTRVQATKYLHWRDPRQLDLTAQACDFGWSDLMEEMASGCARGFPMTEPVRETPMDTAVRQLVEAVTAEWQQGMSDSGPHFEQLIGRFTGSSWDAGWINDLLGMGQVTARRYGNIASGVRRFADSLRDAATERDGHG